MPADRGMSPLVASIALDYAALAATEAAEAPTAPLVVVDTGWRDSTLGALLAPLAALGALRHETAEGEIMGVRHRTHCIEGVQFHPESILTRPGKSLLRNFLAQPITAAPRGGIPNDR